MLKPLADRVVIEPLHEEKKKSGILLPETIDKDREEEGKVIAVGPGKLQDGKRVPVDVKKGDVVVFTYGRKIKLHEKEYYIVDAENILAVKEK